MADVPSRDEVVEMLGSPDLTRAEKRDLLLAYRRYDSTGDDAMEVYEKEFNLGAFEIRASQFRHFGYRDEGLKDVHRRYKAEVEQRVNGGVRAGKDKLEDLKRKTVANSNEILDTGLPGLEVFKRFGQVYAAAPRKGVPELAIRGDAYAVAKERYGEQRDIRFDQLEAHAQALLGAKSAIEASASKSSSGLSGLYGHWSGKAADRSRVFSDRFSVETGHLTESLRGSAELIRSTSEKVAQACRAKVEFALGTHRERLPDRTVAEGLLIMQMANGRWDADVRRAAALVGGAAAKQAASDKCAVNDETRRFVEAEAMKWAQTFCRAFEKLFADFMKMCDNTRETVDKLWKVLTDHLNRLNDNPFKELISGTPPGGGGTKPPNGGGGGGGPIGG
uniref:hypothetical protein n=1 Tax=Allokutzneria sp. NRRL B-24872 TaxID=1137961 RepID=UPI001178A846